MVTTIRTPRSTFSTTITKAVHLVVDGEFAWGTIERPNAGTMGRTGWGHFRIAVYPPGTNLAERRAMTFARRWPYVGVIVSLLVAIALNSDWGFVVGAGVFVAVLLVSRGITSQLRHLTRQIHVSVAVAGGAREVYGDADLFTQTADAFANLDERMLAGDLTPVQYEAGWADIYNALEPRTTRSTARAAR
jgi:hypothetical protein